jgi:hypothetical protein
MADEEVNGAPVTAASADPLAWDPILVLMKPVQASGEKVDKLMFREPTGRDIEEIGMPLLPGWPVRFDPPVMGEMMARLANVPPSTIKALNSRDWTAGAYRIWNFFMPGVR